MHPDEEHLPLACLPGAVACSLLDGVEAAPYKQELPQASLSTSPASASIPSSGAVGAGGDVDFTGYRQLSSSACNALPAIAGGTRLLAYIPCLSNVTYPQQYPFLLCPFLPLCAAQSSPQLLISSHILSLPYILLSITLATTPL